MARVQCPQCSTIVEYSPPAKPVCSWCGYSGGPVRPVAPAQAPRWNAAPGAGAPPPGYAPPGDYATPAPRPGVLVGGIVCALVVAGLLLLVGLVAAFSPDRLLEELQRQNPEAYAELSAGTIASAGVFLLVLAALQGGFAIAALVRKGWGRIGLTVVASLIGLMVLVGFSLPSLVLGGLQVFAVISLWLGASTAWYRSAPAAGHGP